MINSFKNPAIMRILRTTERHGAGWREQNFIPAKKFYEWKAVDRKNKEKYEFYDERGSLYLAAIFHLSDQGKQFTIITRPAAGCMVGIHDRMPLILEKEDIDEWLFSEKASCKLLEKCFEPLHRRKSDVGGYQQLNLFNTYSL